MSFSSGLFSDSSVKRQKIDNDEEIEHSEHEFEIDLNLLEEEKEREEEQQRSIAVDSEDESTKIKKKKSKKRALQDLEERRARLDIRVNEEPFRFPDSGIHLDNDTLANGSNENIGVPPQQYTYFDPDEIDWDDVKEEPHNSEDDEHCPDCDNDQTEEQREVNPAVLEYRAHYEENLLSVEPKRRGILDASGFNSNACSFIPSKTVKRL